MYKCILLIRTDLKMTKGKVVAQCGHAIVNMMQNASLKNKKPWMNNGEKMISLKVNSLEQMHELHNNCIKNNIFSHIVTDAGRTQVDPGTETVCILGPEKEDVLDKYVDSLKLY